MDFKFNLRDKVKDQITGMEGVVVGRTEWLNGCIRYIVQPLHLKDGAPIDSVNFDEDQLDIIKESKHEAPAVRTGGDRKDPTRGQVTRF